jgi:phosphatidylserine decarboxylase
MHATFDSNDLKFHLFILMVFDSHWTRIPAAWLVISRQTRNDLIEWLAPIKVKFSSRMLGWKLACFIIDDAPQELAAL